MTAKFSDAEIEAVRTYAAAARLAVAAYVSEAALRPSAWRVGDCQTPGADADGGGDSAESVRPGPVVEDPPGHDEARRMLLLELMGIHRQLRGAATNLNQAVARLNSLNEPVGELPAVAAYVRRVTTAVDEAVAAVRQRR